MQHYRFSEPRDPDNNDYTPVDITLSKQEVLDSYYEYWSTRMLKINKLPMVTESNCIEDWLVIHWAWPVDSLPQPLIN